MNIKILPALFSTLLIAQNPNNAFVSDDVYKVTDLIWMKNLYFRDGQDFNNPDVSKVIEFDIVFHSTALPYNNYLLLSQKSSSRQA